MSLLKVRMRGTMRVALLGDIHGDVRYLDWALQHAVNSGAEAMIQLGDFGFIFSDEFLSDLADVTDRYGIPMFVVRGNHDDPWWFRTHQRLGDVHLIPDGFVATIGTKTVAFLGGAVSIDRDWREENVSWWKDERVNPHIVNAWAMEDVKADVLICHEAPLRPKGLGSIMIPPDVERDCDEDRNFIRTAAEILEPEFIFHGHYHLRTSTTLFISDGKKSSVEGMNCNGNPINEAMIIREF